ncbi:MAG: B12-binding domain-containing radical SAM protein [Armatimonadota bacterium]
MKMLLIRPKNVLDIVRHGKALMSQLGLAAVAALAPKRFETRIVDENVEPLDFDAPTDLVGITATTPCAPRAYEIGDEFRRRSRFVFMGGPHPSLMPEEALQHADAVVIGEAEGAADRLFEDILAGRPRRIYKAEQLPDLSRLPSPRRDLLRGHGFIETIETSRGCPHNCTFCSATLLFGKRYRFRPVSHVMDEVRRVRRKFVFFSDDNIFGKPSRAKELLSAVNDAGVRWIGQGCINFIDDEELLELTARSCDGIFVGFESLCPDSISEAGKRVNRTHTPEEAVEKIHDAGIPIMGAFIIGFDSDSPDVCERTRDFIERSGIEAPQVTILTPYPGTVLRTRLEAEGRILNSDWSRYTAMQVVHQPLIRLADGTHMSAEALKRAYDAMCDKLYSLRAILRRVWRARSRLTVRRMITYLSMNLYYRSVYRISRGEPPVIAHDRSGPMSHTTSSTASACAPATSPASS